MPAATRPVRMLVLQPCILIALLALPFWATSASLPSSPESYLNQAARVRQSVDRPWAPEAGQLGNLRHLQITAPDCVVRIVSGTANRVFPGTRDVVVVERSRVLDTNPNEQPPPRNVLLATDRARACPGVGSCGVSITPVRRSSDNFVTGAACFTVQLATAHDLLLGGDGLSLLVDQVRQPALRIRLNPSADLRVWLEQVNIGLLSISANAPAHVGGSGQVDFLQASSSDSGSRMFLQDFHASQVGISTTTTGTQCSIRIDADTKAGYYQPARAPGPIAKNYGIEIEGLIDHLDVPVGQVDPQPLSEATRIATRALRDQVLRRAGPAPVIPAFASILPSAKVAVEALSEDPSERVARVVARYLPTSIRITKVALRKKSARLEGMAPDPASAREVARLLNETGEFTYVDGGSSLPRDGGHAFFVQLRFACEVPGQPSACPAGDPAASGAYSEAQVRGVIESLLGPRVTVREVRLDGGKIHLTAGAPNEVEAAAALERLSQGKDFFRLSTSMHGRSDNGSSADIRAILRLTCAIPPKADGICTSRTMSMPGASAGSK